jgi:uncharacterized protein DUF5916/cellulose/xylan binding protein with CBM9 domain
MHRMRLFETAALVMFTATSSVAQNQATGSGAHVPHESIRALRVNRPPAIDGHLTDECWTLAEPATHFVQQDPDEGRPSTESTEVRVAFDDDALYIGVRMWDGEAARISQRLSSRDTDADADRVSIYLDPMHDHKSGVNFRVSASNVQKDTVIFNDSWDDQTWDAVWQSAVSVDEHGWSAEIRIPLSQLRFSSADRQTWGFNVARFIRRKNETSSLEMTPKTESGLASRMAHLTGLNGIHPRRHLELLPYSAARSEFIAPPTAGNPFNDGSRVYAATGLDAKYGLTSNLTLDGTVNPDFGQVEVDPAVINLSAFETFFQEKRPFFLEGAQTFSNFGRDGANDNWGFDSSEPTIFYSRRIGRAPQLQASGDYVEAPTATTILGATKLTGKTPGGWTVAVLEAVTNHETARVRTGTVTSRDAVEPLSNYFAARVQRTLGGRAAAGLMATSVSRKLDTATLKDNLTDQAYVFGADGYLFVDRSHDWVVTGKIAGSHLSGTTAAIDRAQRAPQRYYQRPDAPEVTYDPTRTSLDGYHGRVNLNRNSGTWKLNAAVWGVSPGFESNDLGFMGSGDRGGAHAVLQWRKLQPDRYSRYRSFWVAKWWNWNFGRELQGDGAQANAAITLHNYLNGYTNFGIRRRVQDDRLTRGGPSATNPRAQFWNTGVNTDSRAPLSLQAHINRSWTEAGGATNNVSVTVSVKPSARLTLSSGPQLNLFRTPAQYVTSVTDSTAVTTFGGRYVFGTLDQTQLTMTTRVAVVLTPRVSLQIYAQPLLAAGDYTDFKELARPRAFDFSSYGAGASTLSHDAAARRYTADPDGTGPSSSFTIDDPDFNLKSLRVNAVFRWELKPGSTVYGVWTRQQQDTRFPGDFRLGRDASHLFSARGDDVILVKMAYWIGR